MRLATFTEGGRTRVGVIERAEVVDLSVNPDLPTDMIGFFGTGAEGLNAARSVAANSKQRFALGSVRLEAPVLNPRKFLGLGGSYKSHLAEVAHLGIQPPKFQIWFNKQVTCVNGPYDDIHLPRVSESLDYEAELAIIVGRRCRHLSGAEAGHVIAGFTICNDVSVREWQMRAPTHALGKSFDTHGPIGPWICTPEELAAARNLSIKTFVNGELRQDGNTSELIYTFEEMLVELSAVFTLEPGDILTTGSPAGVGFVRNPRQYLKVGDIVRIEIEGIGHIQNRVVSEP